MELKDWKRYKGYLPLRCVKEDTVRWLGKVIGKSWLDSLWYGKYSGFYTVRFRFGDRNEAQIYCKDHSWLSVPIGMWMVFCENDTKLLTDECWNWILSERRRVGISSDSSHLLDGEVVRRKAVVRGGRDIWSLLGI